MVGTYLLWSTWPNQIGMEAQTERQPPEKASKKVNLQKAQGSGEAACLRQSPGRKTPQPLWPRHCPHSEQRLTSQPSPQSGRLKLPQPICSSGSQSVICYAFASAGGRRGGRRGQINSEALGRHMSNKIKAEVMQSRSMLPNEVTSGLVKI